METDTDTIRFLGDVQRMGLLPGDVIVLSCDDMMTDETADRLRDVMQAKFPGHQCLVLSQGLRIGVMGPTVQGFSGSGIR